MKRKSRRAPQRTVHKVDGFPVVDADQPLEVHVTQRDIDKGKPSACFCAIAVAIKREHGAQWVRVNASRIYVEKDGKLLRFRTPPGIFQQIELFDATGDMGAGVYSIPPLSASHRLGTVHKSDRPASGWRLRPLKKRDRPRYVFKG